MSRVYQRTFNAPTTATTTARCCELHGRDCEPPSELCCDRCTEACHGIHECSRGFSPGDHHGNPFECSSPDLSTNWDPDGVPKP